MIKLILQYLTAIALAIVILAITIVVSPYLALQTAWKIVTGEVDLKVSAQKSGTKRKGDES